MAKTQAMIGFNGGGAFYSQTPESCLKDLGVNIKYPRPLLERVPKAGEGLREKEILRPSAEILSELSTPKAQNDRIIPLSEGRGRNCANGSERTISGEGLVKESQNQVDMLDLAILRRCTPQNDNLKSPLPPFNKGGKTASLLRDVSRSDGGFENTLCHSERSEESQSLANIVSKKILKQVQDDMSFHSSPCGRGGRGESATHSLHTTLRFFAPLRMT